MTADRLTTVLDAGAVVVTPNNRLARDLTARHDAAERALGRQAWPSLCALPFNAWLSALWLDALAVGAVPARAILSRPAALHLWQKIIEAGGPSLLDPRGAARQAAEAWTLFHGWRRSDDRFEAWGTGGRDDDAAAFSRWAGAYRATLASLDACDLAQVSDALAAAAGHVRFWQDRPVALHGFAELSPSQQRLVGALQANGAIIDAVDPPACTAPQLSRSSCATPADELTCALAWARERALRDPEARLGIVIHGLAARRAEAMVLADEVLCPPAVFDAELPRPYGISLGVPLSDVPLVACALDLVALAYARLDAPTLAALARSPYLPDAKTRWWQRASVERTWREQGRLTLPWSEFIGTLGVTDAEFGQRLRACAVPSRSARAPRAWSQTWTDWLGAVGWPGTRSLSSAEWQAREAWSDVLAQFAALGNVTPSLTPTAAVSTLRAIAADTIFQPEGSGATIQLLGVLEASGMPFDGLWLAGFDAERWPGPSTPNALLPLGWQRERSLPHASPSRELDYARNATAAFAQAAREVIASHASMVEGAVHSISPLFVAWPHRSVVRRERRLADVVALARHDLVTWRDDAGPALPVGSEPRGGTALIESQSTCPFQAFALYRLRSEAWPPPGEGLNPMERGTLVHAALAAFWEDVRDKARLDALSEPELATCVNAAVAIAHGKLKPARWRSLAPVIAAGEDERLAAALHAWIAVGERPRPWFAVHDIESGSTLVLGGLKLRFRIDRVDRLAGDGVAIIDYKSGRVVNPARWFAPRPAGTQIGLYALAERAKAPTRPVRAMAYAQVKAGEMKAVGLAADADAWPALSLQGKVKSVPRETWTALTARWAEMLNALAEEFRSGCASVAPRDNFACARCDLQALCRIQALGEEAHGEHATATSEE